MTDATIPADGRLASAIRRGTRYRRAYGWTRFLWRLVRFWLWVPRLLDDTTWVSRARSDTGYLEQPFGVNLAGYLSGENGLGESARLRARALRAAGVPCALNDVHHPDLENGETPGAPVSRDNPYRFNVVWVNAPEVDAFAHRVGRRYFWHRYNIGYWVWEMPEVPAEWLSRFRYFDEIWVPTRFVHDAVAPWSPVPVTRIPHTINPERHAISPEQRMVVPGPDGPRTHSPQGWRAAASVPDHAFVFLFVFHFHAVFERKNPLALIAAFKQSVAREREAFLVIKTAGGTGSREMASMREASEGLNVRILDGVMRRSALDQVMADCDCYVSLHRSEGFGLTLIEAMAHGKPVIATGYGGNMDFMTRDNSYVVSHRLVELPQSVGPYRKGWHWAEPDVAHAATLMRQVYEHRDEAQRVGVRARDDVTRDLHPARIGTLVRDRLEVVSAGAR